MPFVYSLAYPAIQWGGLAAGRLITAALALAGVLAAAMLAGRLARPGQNHLAAVVCFILALVNVYQVYFCTVVKTYSLTMLFLTSALLALYHALARRNGFLTMLSAALLVLAAGTRTSAAVVLPIVFGLLWLERRRVAFAGWIYFAFGGIIAALLVFGPFLLQCPLNFIYFAGFYHALRHEGNLLSAMIFKAGFASRVLQAYFVCFVFWVAAVIFKLFRRQLKTVAGLGEAGPGSSRFVPMRYAIGTAQDKPTPATAVSAVIRRSLWLGAIAVSLVHFFAPFPYDDYQVFIYPFFAIAVALMIVEEIRERGGKWVMLAALGLSLASAISSPINQDWFIEGRELIWWRAKDKPPLVKLRETAHKIRLLCKPNDLLLTQDPYLAVEAGCALPHGLEMGQFSYFPDLTRKQAEKMNVLNRDMFADLLQNCNAPLAALSGYAFAIQAPQITPLSSADKALFGQLIRDRYEQFETVTNFGQASTELRLYRRK
jgi:hypothetical protein